MLTDGYIISGIIQGRVQSLLDLICHSGLDGKVNGVRLFILLCLPPVHFRPEGSYKVLGTRCERQPVRFRRVLWRLEKREGFGVYLSIACTVTAWVDTIRRELTREASAESFSR